MTGTPPKVAIEFACPVVAPEAVREETERILADPSFRYTQRSSNLLRFIVDRSLNGRHGDLKERIIGIEVFGRSPDYDTSNDSIVRVVANEVRKRLAEYYSKPEHAHEIRVEIPVRSYIAEFRLPEPEPPGQQPKNQPEPEQKHPTIRRWQVLTLAAVVLALALWVSVRMMLPTPAIDRFWTPIVKASGPALLCVGSPYDPFESSGAPEGRTPSPNSATHDVPFYYSEQRVYVRMLDAKAANDLAAYLRGKGKDSEVRPTQGTQLTELSSGPLILFGMALNESAVKFGADNHFLFRKESESGHGLRWIEDTGNPTDKKWFVDLSVPYEQVSKDYALITRVRDQTTGRWWIGIAGLTGVGTFAANQVVVDPKAMSTIAASLPKDWDHKNLQILLEVKVVQGHPGSTRVLTAYTW